MVNASDVAARKYDAPVVVARQRTKHTLKYSIHAKEIFQHLTFHRVCFASDFPRFLPHRFKDERLARKHLESIAVEGDIDVLEFADQNKPQIYVINDQGFQAAQRQLERIPHTFPAHKEREVTQRSHALHEALISELASRRHKFFLTHPDYKLIWKERYGIRNIPGFEDRVVDYADCFQGPHGMLIDLAEVFSGEQSITRVKRKLKKLEEWVLSPEFETFVQTAYSHFGGDPSSRACRIIITAHQRDLVGTDYGWEREILGATFDLHAEVQKRIWTMPNSSLKQSNDIDSPIWHCGAHLIRHRPEYKELPVRRRYSFLTNLLADEAVCPKLPLFSFAG